MEVKDDFGEYGLRLVRQLIFLDHVGSDVRGLRRPQGFGQAIRVMVRIEWLKGNLVYAGRVFGGRWLIRFAKEFSSLEKRCCSDARAGWWAGLRTPKT